jgi:cytochrome c peroxidase
VPRNVALADTKDPNYFDFGVCGPIRKDIAEQTPFCGMLETPTLRKTAARRAFFHNGVFRTLQPVMDFYNFRDTNPEKVYPAGADGKAQKYNDIPGQYHANVDVADPPSTAVPAKRRR